MKDTEISYITLLLSFLTFVMVAVFFIWTFKTRREIDKVANIASGEKLVSWIQNLLNNK